VSGIRRIYHFCGIAGVGEEGYVCAFIKKNKGQTVMKADVFSGSGAEDLSGSRGVSLSGNGVIDFAGSGAEALRRQGISYRTLTRRGGG
jgi:hypothetical protein